MKNNITEDKVDLKQTSLNMNVFVNIDDGKNKVDKIIDEFAESERLNQGVHKIKKGAVVATKFSIYAVIIWFILLVLFVAIGIVH